MAPTKVVAVVASNREKCLHEFLAAWSPAPWDETIVVEDGPRRSFALGTTFPQPLHHFSWAEMAEDVDVVAQTTFSRRDSAIKLYGFWAAVRLGADVLLTLDDDCFPSGTPGDFLSSHLAALSPRSRWVRRYTKLQLEVFRTLTSEPWPARSPIWGCGGG